MWFNCMYHQFHFIWFAFTHGFVVFGYHLHHRILSIGSSEFRPRE